MIAASATRERRDTAATPTVQGAVFGFDVYSTLRFETLRAAGGGDRLDVETRLVAGPVAGDALVGEIRQRHFLARIYHDGSTYRMWVRGAGWFEVDPTGRRVSIPPTSENVQREELLWGVPALLCFLERGDVSLHAAAVEVDGQAIVLAAAQAGGKSTLAAAFAELGYRILSEDLTCIRVEGAPSVVPGPATVRLRNDVAARTDVTFGRRLSGAPDRARYAIGDALRGGSRPIPIRAVALLRPSRTGIRVEPVKKVQALRQLWQLGFRITRAHERACFERVVELARQLPIYNLYRPLRLEALATTVEEVLAGAETQTTDG